MPSSVTDLINLANFDLNQRQDTPNRVRQATEQIANQIRAHTERKRKNENQRKLSDMITKNFGNLEPEYSVGEAGGITVKYKSKKDPGTKFADAVKEAGERIGAGDDFNEVSGELNSQFPKLYNDRIDSYLANFIPDADEGDTTTRKGRKKPKKVGRFDPRRVLPAFAHTGDQDQKDEFGFVVGEVKSKGEKKYKYIGNDQWEQL